MKVFLKENYREVVAGGPIRSVQVDVDGRPYVLCTTSEAKALRAMRMVEEVDAVEVPPAEERIIVYDTAVEAPPVEEITVEETDVVGDEEEEPVSIDDLVEEPVSIDDLELPVNVSNILRHAGFETVESLVGETVESLVKVNGIGKKTAEKIVTRVAKFS